jgi:hypothetical protein
MEGHRGHVPFFLSTLKRQAKRPSSGFSFFVGGAESSAIGRALKNARCITVLSHQTDVADTFGQNIVSAAAEASEREKKSLERASRLRGAGAPTGLHEVA